MFSRNFMCSVPVTFVLFFESAVSMTLKYGNDTRAQQVFSIITTFKDNLSISVFLLTFC